MMAPNKDPQTVVEQFFQYCCDLDFENAFRLIADDCVYRNMPFHTATGKATRARLLCLQANRWWLSLITLNSDSLDPKPDRLEFCFIKGHQMLLTLLNGLQQALAVRQVFSKVIIS